MQIITQTRDTHLIILTDETGIASMFLWLKSVLANTLVPCCPCFTTSRETRSWLLRIPMTTMLEVRSDLAKAEADLYSAQLSYLLSVAELKNLAGDI